jgi:hypothetical protein
LSVYYLSTTAATAAAAAALIWLPISLSILLFLATNDTANTRTINGDIKKYNDSSVSKAKQKHHRF